MSRPRITTKKHSIAMMPGCYRFIAIMECGWCGNDIQVEADNDEEACIAFAEEGVREVGTSGIIGLFCPDCVELARKNKLEE